MRTRVAYLLRTRSAYLLRTRTEYLLRTRAAYLLRTRAFILPTYWELSQDRQHILKLLLYILQLFHFTLYNHFKGTKCRDWSDILCTVHLQIFFIAIAAKTEPVNNAGNRQLYSELHFSVVFEHRRTPDWINCRYSKSIKSISGFRNKIKIGCIMYLSCEHWNTHE